MLNDRSSALSLLETRRSAKPRELVGRAPRPARWSSSSTIAARTPDHGKLFPWRFVTVADDQRDAFGALLRQALVEHDPCATDRPSPEGRRVRPLCGAAGRAGLGAGPDHKIPLWEQELSCGAAGMNLLLAAHALGYVAGWVTGWRAYSERVRAAFCGPGERIAGFIFIGHPGREIEERPRPPLRSVSRNAGSRLT